MQNVIFHRVQSAHACARKTDVPAFGIRFIVSIQRCVTSFLVGGYTFFSPTIAQATASVPVNKPQLWHEIAQPSRSEDSLLNVLIERHRKSPFVKRAILVETHAELLKSEQVSISIGGHSATIQTLLGEMDSPTAFVRYGGFTYDRLNAKEREANIGEIFFAVNQGLIASKFYFEDEIYALMPIYKHYHLLLQLKSNQLPNECGTVHRFGATPSEAPVSADYRLRVLVTFSQVAVSGLKQYSRSMTPEHFAQLAIWENNLAHWRNPKRTPHLNLEKVAVLSYSELEMKRDLANLAAERPPFDLLQRWRTEAATDLQILIRSSEDALFGMARAETDGWSSGRAFCVMTLNGFGFTPYSLAHQIEHLRPEAKEPNDNTIAPSVFQARLNHRSPASGVSKDRMVAFSKGLAVENEENVLKTPFFMRHSIFYGEMEVDSFESTSIDTLALKWLDEEPIALLRYWEILPFDALAIEKQSASMDSLAKTHPNQALKTAHLPQTVDILQQDSAPKEDDEVLPDKKDASDFKIMPNPTHGETFLEYRVADNGVPIQLDLVTLTGRFVARLAENPTHPAGKFTVQWDASAMPTGVYVCILRMGAKMHTLRVVVE
jgi:hypothetical protein